MMQSRENQYMDPPSIHGLHWLHWIVYAVASLLFLFFCLFVLVVYLVFEGMHGLILYFKVGVGGGSHSLLPSLPKGLWSKLLAGKRKIGSHICDMLLSEEIFHHMCAREGGGD